MALDTPWTRSANAAENAKRDLRRTNYFLIPLLLFGLLFVFAHLWGQGFVSTGLLWAFACLVSGIVIGFLFGIPKVLQKDETPPPKPAAGGGAQEAAPASERGPKSGEVYSQRVNTNLTEISDWLTKIIVGLGLVNLHKVPPLIGGLADIFASGLNSREPGKEKAFAVALIVGFSTLGFLFGYLYTRLFLAGAFARADQGVGDRIEDILALTAKAAAKQGDSMEAREPTDVQLAAAAEVAELVSPEDISTIRQKLVGLAREYERIRATMPPGNDRTRKMEIVVAQMRTLALAGYSLLPEFMKSDSAGERLVAIAMLQVKPNIEYVNWLAERFGKERPFVVYHAGLALLHAVRTFGVAEFQTLQNALQMARRLAGDNLKGTDRAKILETAEKELLNKASTPSDRRDSGVETES